MKKLILVLAIVVVTLITSCRSAAQRETAAKNNVVDAKQDLQDTKVCNEAICSIKELMIVTNTKFTSAAEKYALCRGVTLLSWEYPKGNNLHDRIQKTGLYPITVLQTLSSSQKNALIEKGVVVCADLLQKPELLRHAHINLARTQLVLEEAKKLSVTSVGI